MAFAFTYAPRFDRYEDLRTMSPVQHITTENIKSIFLKVLKALMEIGFTVVSVTTDGHRTNQSFHNSLGDDGRHPKYIKNPHSSDPDACVYTMYDTVHSFKNMYFKLFSAHPSPTQWYDKWFYLYHFNMYEVAGNWVTFL